MAEENNQPFEYTIGGRKFHQKPIVLGQMKQLVESFVEIKFPKTFNVAGIIDILGDRLPLAAAIVLREKNKPLYCFNSEEGIWKETKDTPELEGFFMENLTPDVAFRIIEDFFDCNPISLIFNQIAGLAGTFSKKIAITNSSESFAGVTLPKETASSGDTLSGNARSS